MNKFISVISVVLIVIMVLGGVLLWREARNDDEVSTKLSYLSEENNKAIRRIASLTKERDELIIQRDAITKAGGYIVLFFEDLSENLNNVYELMSAYDFKATIVMRDGLLPGEVGNISRERFDYITSDGWATAIGGSSEIDMTADNAPELLDEYLEEYIGKLTQAEIWTPVTFCFDKGDYDPRFEDVLRKHGFKAIRHFGEQMDVFGSGYSKGDFYYIGSHIYSEESDGTRVRIDEANEKNLAFSVSVRYVMNAEIDPLKDSSVDKYRKMLVYLLDDTSCPNLSVVSMDDLYYGKTILYNENNAKIQEFNDKIAEVEKEIAAETERNEKILEEVRAIGSRK